MSKLYKNEQRTLDAAKDLEARGRIVTQEALAKALGATGGDRRPLGSTVASLKRRGALAVVGRVKSETGNYVESLKVTGLVNDDPGPPISRRERALDYVAGLSEEDYHQFLLEAVAIHDARQTPGGDA